MRIRFETTIEDLIAFNRFHFANSPAWRRQIWTQVLLLAATFTALFVLIHLMAIDAIANPDEILQFGVYDFIIAAVLLPGWLASSLFLRWYLNWSLGRNTRRFLAEGSNRSRFGWRDMELVNNRLILKTELIDSSLDLRAIEKIVSDGQYTYVYVASTSAYMIPMNLYPEDDYREFVAELREAWENREAPWPVEKADRRAACPTDERIAEKPL